MKLNHTTNGGVRRVRYLFAKVLAEFSAYAGAIIAFAIGGVFFLKAILIPKSSTPIWTTLELLLGVVVCYAFGMWMYCRSALKSRAIEYVAPLRDQIEALPQRGILVRSSEVPEEAAGNLVRPINEGLSSSTAELLHVTADEQVRPTL